MDLDQLIKTDGLVAQTAKFAKEAHKDQKRLSGEPYFSHLLETAKALAGWGLDEKTVAAGFLHDTIEDTSVTLEDIKAKFGPEVGFLVDGVTKLGKLKYRGRESQAENIRKMILAMAEDLRVVFIKLADREHNMKTLSALPPVKQKRIALETTEIYAPLAYRLGMQQLSGELEDLAFPYLYPQEYRWLLENTKYRYEERVEYLKKIKPLVEKALNEAGIIPLFIDFRAKRYSSLYKKLKRYDMDIEKIHDLVAFRIIIKNIEDCYAAMGIVHKLWPPLPGRIKDYIAMPKPNGYRSLHTTVMCLGGQIVEFQIRTEEMHRESENGLAAHWAYEEAKTTKEYRERGASRARPQEIEWVNRLRTWQKEFGEDENFLNALKIDFFRDRIFAITPKGEVVDLPDGATPVDFAYQIHTAVGHECVAAKVNQKIVPLDYKLRSQDIVEIITQKNKKPSADWLKFVITAKAKYEISAAIKAKQGTFRRKERQTELKIIAEDRLGLLKDISSIISRSHINIANANSSLFGKGNFHQMKIRCETEDQEKISKVIMKIKSLKGIREIESRLI